jgi:anti-sigma regulatory factor (Ser/Thr protein kinase)
VNDLLHPDIPPNMFVTCLYAVLDTRSGHLYFANAGHNLPYLRTASGVREIRATGMPLGLMPGMTYEEQRVALGHGECVLFHSDGLVEAHNAQREMFGFPKLMGLVASHPGGEGLIDHLLAELSSFAGADHEQEDDITLVTLQRAGEVPARSVRPLPGSEGAAHDGTRVLADFEIASEPGNERAAMERVAEAVRDLRLEPARLERLKTAVAEATMNAIEHGNKNQADLPVTIQLLASPVELAVRVTDHGGGQAIPEPEEPDIESKLEGEQTPRGWGLFLIKNMVDDLRVTSDDTHHTVELVLKLEGVGDGE